MSVWRIQVTDHICGTAECVSLHPRRGGCHPSCAWACLLPEIPIQRFRRCCDSCAEECAHSSIAQSHAQALFSFLVQVQSQTSGGPNHAPLYPPCSFSDGLLVANAVNESLFPIAGSSFPALLFIWLPVFRKTVEMLHLGAPCSAVRLG